jgi:hypothetical protein
MNNDYHRSRPKIVQLNKTSPPTYNYIYMLFLVVSINIVWGTDYNPHVILLLYKTSSRIEIEI